MENEVNITVPDVQLCPQTRWRNFYNNIYTNLMFPIVNIDITQEQMSLGTRM